MPSGIWKTSWKSGPAARGTGPGSSVVVSITEYSTHRPWGTPAVAFEGMRLRRSRPRTPGAVALRLWRDPGPRPDRSGSVIVRTDEASLMRFVARPDHLRIVRAFRGRGTMRSALRETALGAPRAGFPQAAGPALAPLRADAERIPTGGVPWN
ncbi:hypothetical protein ACFQ6U_15805 [Streptomyces sp. NPDC056465]|uniref:hypothetical protein n=1 Tax=Streptomyces sp. NPDC056465 TaxID=3345829 RepID=UPI0036CAD2AC